MLRCFVNANKDDWDQYITQVVWGYYTEEHAVMRETEHKKWLYFNFSSEPESLTINLSEHQERKKEINEILSKRNAQVK